MARRCESQPGLLSSAIHCPSGPRCGIVRGQAWRIPHHTPRDLSTVQWPASSIPCSGSCRRSCAGPARGLLTWRGALTVQDGSAGSGASGRMTSGGMSRGPRWGALFGLVGVGGIVYGARPWFPELCLASRRRDRRDDELPAGDHRRAVSRRPRRPWRAHLAGEQAAAGRAPSGDAAGGAAVVGGSRRTDGRRGRGGRPGHRHPALGRVLHGRAAGRRDRGRGHRHAVRLACALSGSGRRVRAPAAPS